MLNIIKFQESRDYENILKEVKSEKWQSFYEERKNE